MDKKLLIPAFPDLLKDQIPEDHARQVEPEYYLERLIPNKSIKRVMDLGCGAGDSVDYFRGKDPDINWVGLDIENSAEVRSRTRVDAEFRVFDGVTIPFDRDYFDLIYCRQVLEHVRYPAILLKDVERVLRPGGCFVGSVSHLEPYHSYSVSNFTPYGFHLLMEEAGLELCEIRPGIDAITLIVRRGLGAPRCFSQWFVKESPLNWMIGLWGRFSQKHPRLINAAKLLFCGQFSFFARKRTSQPLPENCSMEYSITSKKRQDRDC